jgi:hypothetical protein
VEGLPGEVSHEVPRQEFLDVIDRVVGDAGQHVTQIELRVGIVEFRCANQTVDYGGAFLRKPACHENNRCCVETFCRKRGFVPATNAGNEHDGHGAVRIQIKNKSSRNLSHRFLFQINNKSFEWPGAIVLFYYTGRMVVNKKGKTVRERPAVFICEYSDKYRNAAQVENHEKYLEIMRPVAGRVPSGVLSFSAYVENTYLPYIAAAKKQDGDSRYTPSTQKGYRNMYTKMIKPHGNIPFTDFADPGTTQRILDLLSQDQYSKRTLQHVKRFISGLINPRSVDNEGVW